MIIRTILLLFVAATTASALSEENVTTLVNRALTDTERGLGASGLKLGVGAIDEIMLLGLAGMGLVRLGLRRTRQ